MQEPFSGERLNSQDIWEQSLIEQISFYACVHARKRTGSFFEYFWPLLQESSIKARFKKFAKSILRSSNPIAYLKENSLPLWEARNLFDDELSRHCFDQTIVLRSVGFNKYYYPFFHSLDIFKCLESKPFIPGVGLPSAYLGIPLHSCRIDLYQRGQLEIIAPCSYPQYQRVYGQYFPVINNEYFLPPIGGVVYDCGSCIGEVSAVFAGMVGAAGQVHCFDPVSIHIQFCKLQQELNPHLPQVFHFCEAGVDAKSCQALCQGDKSHHQDSKISPGNKISGHSTTSLDDYTKVKGIDRVDYVKMDIEGYEAAALEGSKTILRDFKPMLAISAYHKSDDLWTLPRLVTALNPQYKLYFRHHSPCQWESVIYAQ